MPQLNLRREVSRRLGSDGFQRTDRMHLKRLDETFSLWVDTGPLGSRGDIAPFAGLRHDGVQDLRADLMELPRDPITATVGANIGYILDGNYRSWNEPAQLEKVIEHITRALDIIAAHASFDGLLRFYAIPALTIRRRGSRKSRFICCALISRLRWRRSVRCANASAGARTSSASSSAAWSATRSRIFRRSLVAKRGLASCSRCARCKNAKSAATSKSPPSPSAAWA